MQGASGQFERAISYHQQQLEIAQALADDKAIGAAWGDLGRCYQFKGEYEKAIACHERYRNSCLTQDDSGEQTILDERGYAIAIDNLGLAHRALGHWDVAIRISP